VEGDSRAGVPARPGEIATEGWIERLNYKFQES
jgi:hypothetical protein